ncbi:MAG: lipoate--protein ligase family protein, partial [Thermoplasmatales archaeon]|nr:lipoate--protein ligase family protein [Thermoplasmatales archaeon]
MQKWRLVDTGKLTAAENMALDETLLENKKNGNSPNTVRFLQFHPPAVLLGYHQSLEQEIRIEFCKQVGIDINRRVTGGGAIFFDETQLGWEIICEKQFFEMGIVNVNFFSRLSQPLIYALEKLGIDASFRPRNDIEVKGRKISGTGGTEDGDVFLFQGTLLVDFDIDTMLKALRIPIAKLKDKEIDTAKERVTCLKWELGYVPEISELKNLLKEGFEKEFNIVLEPGRLTKEEKLLFNGKKIGFESQERINKIKLPKNEQQMISSIYKAEGGIIRISMVVNLSYNRIQSVVITGDFFAYPKRIILDLEAE